MTGVQTCALPIFARWGAVDLGSSSAAMRLYAIAGFVVAAGLLITAPLVRRLAATPSGARPAMSDSH